MDDITIEYMTHYSEKLINKTIYLYLIYLFNYIFFKPQISENLQKKLEALTTLINSQILKIREKYINLYQYSWDNFYNIVNFVKMQNTKFAGDIIEGILIIMFSKVIKVDKSKTFGKYLFNNISRLKEIENDRDNLLKWFENANRQFKNEELNDFSEILKKETEPVNFQKDLKETTKKNTIINLLLYEIMNNKYSYLQEKTNNNKGKLYINRGDLNSKKMNEDIYQFLKKSNSDSSTIDRETNYNSISKMMEDYNYYSHNLGYERNTKIRLFRALLISTFIFYQNKNSPLMKYIPKLKEINNNIEYINSNEDDNNENENNLVDLPFEYDLKQAAIEGRFAYIVFSPLRIEPKISKIIISQNSFREFGFYEVAKVLLFNQSLKKIEYNISLVKSYYLDYFIAGLGLFDNYSIESLNLSHNYLKEDSGEFLSKILSHLKGLKTLNISGTELKSGLSFLFILLKKLYRKGKIHLENLYLNKSNLDETSYYELGELLKSKYCKLKRLFLTVNNKTNNFNFLEKLKKNTSLEEINLIKGNYGNLDVKDINKLISCTNLKHIYLSRNKINNFNTCIRIIYRTKLMNEINDKDINQYGVGLNENIIIDNNTKLINLDLSNNESWNLNKKQVKLIDNIIKETTLRCLDISHILFGPNPEKSKQNQYYKNPVIRIKNSLEAKKNFNKIIFQENYSNKIDIFNLKHLEEEEIIKKINSKFEKFINETIDDENAIYEVFLKEKALKIIENIINNKEENKDIIREAKLVEDINSEKNREFMGKLADFMKLKRLERDLINNNKILDKKKLILI